MNENSFISGRKRMHLNDSQLLRKGDERRLKFTLEIRLSAGDDILNGMPEFVSAAYSLMAKSRNKGRVLKFDERLDNMAIDFYPTDKAKARLFTTIIGATLSGFQMEKRGKAEEPDIALVFQAYFNGRREIYDWAYDHKKADFWLSFEQQQGEIFEHADDDPEAAVTATAKAEKATAASRQSATAQRHAQEDATLARAKANLKLM